MTTAPRPNITTSERTCSVPDCDRPHYAREFCRLHYQRNRKHGHPLGGLWWLASRQKRRAIYDECLQTYREVVARLEES